MKKNWAGILVYIENKNGMISPVSLELIGEAHRLSLALDEKVYVFAIGQNICILENNLKGYPIDEAYLYETPTGLIPNEYEKPLTDCIRTLRPSIVLIGGTGEGKLLAPRLAVEFQTGLTADCTELYIDEKKNLIQVRPAFGGNIMAKIVTEHARPQLATVRSGIFPMIDKDEHKSIKINRYHCRTELEGIRIINMNTVEIEKGIADEELLIVAGRGVQKKDDLLILSELAHKLGGQLASTRALVEKGWMPEETQIGLSGMTVRPKFIVTFGVSGSVQFMTGMRMAENIIAVNHNSKAPIFEIAHYSICADLYEVIPELLSILKK